MHIVARATIGLAIIISVAAAIPAAAQETNARAVLTLPTTGTFARGGEFSGTISINRFERRGDAIVAVGFVAGVLSRGPHTVGTAVAGEVAWPVRVRSGAMSLVSGPSRGLRGGMLMPIAWLPAAPTASSVLGRLQPETCPVLNVALGPTTVDLLGAQVALSGVSLDLTGVTGTALGDLVCAASDLLGNVAGLVNLLNSVLGLVTGLLGGLTGGIGGGGIPIP